MHVLSSECTNSNLPSSISHQCSVMWNWMGNCMKHEATLCQYDADRCIHVKMFHVKRCKTTGCACDNNTTNLRKKQCCHGNWAVSCIGGPTGQWQWAPNLKSSIENKLWMWKGGRGGYHKRVSQELVLGIHKSLHKTRRGKKTVAGSVDGFGT